MQVGSLFINFIDSFYLFLVIGLQKGDHPIGVESGDTKKVVDHVNLLPAFHMGPRSAWPAIASKPKWSGMKMILPK